MPRQDLILIIGNGRSVLDYSFGEQINKFYGSGTATVLPRECITDDHSQSDFKLIDENEGSPDQPLT